MTTNKDVFPQNLGEVGVVVAIVQSTDDTNVPCYRIIREKRPPLDTYNIVYFSFYFLGVSTLLPWNFFISVNSYWDYKFRNVTDDGGSNTTQSRTELQNEFLAYLSIASNVPNAIVVILNALCGHRFPINYRLIFSMTSIITCFIGVAALALINTDAWQIQFFRLTLSLVVLSNIAIAICQGGIFGLAGRFPAKYMAAVMAGQALGGILPAVVNIIVVSTDIDNAQLGFTCFFVAVIILLTSLISYVTICRTDFYRYYTIDSIVSDSVDCEDDDADIKTCLLDSTSEKMSSVSFRNVFGSCWPYCIAVFLIFVTSLALFPGVTVLAKSSSSDTDSSWSLRYFTPVACFLLFNLCDYFGRVIGAAVQFPSQDTSPAILLLLATLRIVFIPLFMYCNVAPNKRTLPVVFYSDVDFILFMIGFATSNGYLGNLCMIYGPKSVGTAGKTQEVAAMILLAFLLVGTGVGSFFSYVIFFLL